MPDDPERYLTLRQADQARDDFAALETHLEFFMHQMAQLPTYKELAKSWTVSRSRR